MNEQQWSVLATPARNYERIDREKHAVDNRTRAFEEMGHPLPEEAVVEIKKQLRKHLKDAKENVEEALRDTGPAAAFVEGTPFQGLLSTGLVLGLLARPLEQYYSHSAVWRGVGLHVNGNRKAVSRNNCGPSGLGFPPALRAYALYRMGDPHIKATGTPYETKSGTVVQPTRSPFRDVYEDRKADTLETHPPMYDEERSLLHPDCKGCQRAAAKNADEGVGWYDCGNVSGNREGSHWKPAHRDNDARRYMVKGILMDLWRVENGQPPRVGVLD